MEGKSTQYQTFIGHLWLNVVTDVGERNKNVFYVLEIFD